jgi:hypothetical protein
VSDHTHESDDLAPADRELLRELAAATRASEHDVDGLIDSCEGLLTWLDVDAELAALLDQSVEAAGTRGGTAPSTTLEFAVADGTCVVEAEPTVDSLVVRVHGAEATRVTVRAADGWTVEVALDESGEATTSRPPDGPVRIEIEIEIPENRRIQTDWFVI